jgi:hypothetical protein
MSSIESMVIELDEHCKRILLLFESKIDEKDPRYKTKQLTEDEIKELLREVSRFHRRINYILHQVEKLIGNKADYAERGRGVGIAISDEEYRQLAGIEKEELEERLQPMKTLNKISSQIINKLTTGKQMGYVTFYEYGPIEKVIKGAVANLKDSFYEHESSNSSDARRSFYCAYKAFKEIVPDLIDFQEELRYVSLITSYPISKKIEIKRQLLEEGFEQTVISLEEAESNAEEEHFRDCISRCRDAIEITVATIREKETEEKTEKRFIVDLKRVKDRGVFDEGLERLASGIYSFLARAKCEVQRN